MNVDKEQKARIDEIVVLLKQSQSILFITGAGISADSGLPTYRGIGGLYNDQTTKEGIPIEVVLAGETLRSQPQLTWKYLGQIEERCRGARFNQGHQVIFEMEKHFKRVWTLTQNIDGFHHQTGSKNVIDIHGDMHELVCPHCHWQHRVKDYSEIKIPPHCPQCGKIVRPDVVFFGEMLPYAKTQKLYQELGKGFDLYFSIGTTSVFPYIAQPVYEAKSRGVPSIEINPGETCISGIVDIKLSLGAACALDALWKAYHDA